MDAIRQKISEIPPDITVRAIIISEKKNGKTLGRWSYHCHLPKFTCTTRGDSLKCRRYFCSTLHNVPLEIIKSWNLSLKRELTFYTKFLGRNEYLSRDNTV